MEFPRVAQLAKRLEANGLDAFFGWSEVNLGYLTGYFEHAGHRFLTLAVSSTGKMALICGALSENQARRFGIEDVRVWRDGEDPLALFKALAEEWNLRTAVVAVDEDMPALMVLPMQAELPAALFKNGGPLLAELRRKKDASELEKMLQAGRIADDAFIEIKAKIRAGMTELDLERVINDAMARRGGNPNFCIVATGRNGAEPHHVSDSTVIQHGDVLILDFGCDVEGYRSDITRTVAVGTATDFQKQIYRTVMDAHLAGRAITAPGRKTGEIDHAARAVIESAGYGKEFMHRLGHGIGLMGHEMPYLITNGEVVLQEGDCFSIEPGIYLPGQFGVRIENIYTAVPGGWKSFNVEPAAELETVG